MIKISTILLLLFSLNLFAQGVDPRIVKAERERFHNQQQLSKVMYPGDSEIDVTYYCISFCIYKSEFSNRICYCKCKS